MNETINVLTEKINWNEVMSKKQRKICPTLNYIEDLFFLVSASTGCISISAFASLVGIPIWTLSPAIGLKNCAITAAIKCYKPIVKKQKKEAR